MIGLKKASIYIRNFVFGVEDSLVSTAGVITGVAFSGAQRHIILLTGIVVIFVEAFSMGAGSFLSEDSVEEYINDHKKSYKNSLSGAFVMFISYFIAGLVPIFPYVFWSTFTAIMISISLSLASLFVLGVFISRILKVSIMAEGLKMVIIGGVAMLVGILAGMIIG